MKIVYNWLKDFVDVTLAPEALRSRLSLAGISVDTLEDSPAGPVLDAELTTNRPDCLGHLGIAREVAAIERKRLRAVEPKLRELRERAADVTRVDIECPDLCGRFTARVLRGVKIGPSPDWLRQRLEAIGQTPINNVVDATNYVMFELGHPLHAFDFDTLKEHRIVVRRAKKSERMRTLDGTDRALTAEMCMVCDAVRSTGIGGVMGGAETEIGLASNNVLLECAWFDPISIRRTSKALGLRTEASLRFERGADPELAELASRRCAELIQQIAGGEVLAGFVDAYPGRRELPKIELTRKELLRVMGADVPDRDIEEILSELGFKLVRADHNRGVAGSLAATWECSTASWRRDVSREIDLIEEVARHYGFDKFPPRLPAAKLPALRLPHAEAEDRVRECLLALGYDEVVSIPIVDPERDALFHAGGAVKLTNPLAEDASALRSSGLTNVLQAVEWNLNRGQRNLRLFEIGSRYELRDGKPVETRILTLSATGEAREKSVHEPARDYSFADLKGELDSVGALAGGLHWENGGPDWLSPARAATISMGGHGFSRAEMPERKGGASAPEVIGAGGQLARRVAERFKLRQEVFAAELVLAPLYDAYARARGGLRYHTLPRFPAVERDFSLVVADGITFAQVRDVIRSLGIAELDRVEAGDLYRGKGIASGKFSLLVRATFQSHSATLTEAQLTDFTSRIVAALEQKLGANLRTQ